MGISRSVSVEENLTQIQLLQTKLVKYAAGMYGVGMLCTFFHESLFGQTRVHSYSLAACPAFSRDWTQLLHSWRCAGTFHIRTVTCSLLIWNTKWNFPVWPIVSCSSPLPEHQSHFSYQGQAGALAVLLGKQGSYISSSQSSCFFLT